MTGTTPEESDRATQSRSAVRAASVWLATRGYGVALLAAVAVVLGGAVALAATATAYQSEQNPAVEDVTATVEDGNLTIQVRASNVTEIDVTGVPADWTVVRHVDDDGVYGDRVTDEGLVRWFWTAQFDVNVSVTFALPAERFEAVPTLNVVPYAGTIEGDSVAVSPPLPTPTPTATPTPTPTPTATPTPTLTPTPTPTPTQPPEGGTATTTDRRTTAPAAPEDGPEPTTGTTGAEGPGFGAVGVVVAGVLLAVVAAARRRLR